MSSRLVSLLGSAPFKKPGPSADFEKVNGQGHYLKEILIFNQDLQGLHEGYLVKDYSI